MPLDRPLAMLRATVLLAALLLVLALAWATSGHDGRPAGREGEGERGAGDPAALVARGFALGLDGDHVQAVSAFRAAQAMDATCSPCFWGEAWARGPGVDAPMAPAALPAARAALAHARAVTGSADVLDRAVIDALAMRYGPEAFIDQAAAERSFVVAMRALAARFPANATIAVLAAHAQLASQPRPEAGDGRVAALTALRAAAGLSPGAGRM